MERRTAEEKCPSHHIMSEAHIMTADVDLDHGGCSSVCQVSPQQRFPSLCHDIYQSLQESHQASPVLNKWGVTFYLLW